LNNCKEKQKKSLSDHIRKLINSDRRTTAKRLKKISEIKRSLDDPMQTLEDDIRYICEQEDIYFGISLSYSISEVVGINTQYDCSTVLDNAPAGNDVVLCCSVSKFNEIKTKNGKTPGQLMAFVTLEDSSGRLDSAVLFPDQYHKKNKRYLYESSIVIVKGSVAKNREIFIIEELKQG
jgi:DNA polymerase III alpha subunit